ncbi:MAG: DUF6941 family protein [Acidimicrobiales bacterium]
MNVTMLLCDAAQVAEGKLYILGAGWSIIGPEPTASAIALKMAVEGGEIDGEHEWQLALLDEAGQGVVIETPEGPHPAEVQGEFRVRRPDGLPEGSPVDVALAVNLGPLPLQTGQRFAWRLTVDGRTEAGWTLPFATRAAQGGA